MLGVVSLVFFLFQVLPADPARMLLGQRADGNSLENIKKDLGLDKSIGVQYLSYLNDLSPISVHSTREGSFWYANPQKYSGLVGLYKTKNKGLFLKYPYLRRSFQSNKPVISLLSEAFVGTMILALVSIIIASFFGILLGVLASLFPGGVIDWFLMGIGSLGIAMPSFLSSILLAWLFGFVYQKYTGLPMYGDLYEMDPFTGPHLQIKNIILPAIALGSRPLSLILQLTRASMLEELGKDYIRTARAKGLKEFRVIFKHALVNGINPVITAISSWLASLLAGSFFVEYIFSWNGIGKVTIDALEKYDLPVVMGSVLLVSVIFIGINILLDLVYTWIDPRIKLNEDANK